MKTKYGFTKMTVSEFETYISKTKIARTVLRVQEHHTYIPSYVHFRGSNHFELQRAMRSSHINDNGWSDIGQHLSIFPDGSIVTGRSFEKSPACIRGNNANSFCIENVGNFDAGQDTMTVAQKDAIVSVTAALCKKFGLHPNTNTIVYHHWFNQSTGARNNGSGDNKTCPGTAFFGGNKVDDCNNNFIPLVSAKLNNLPPATSKEILKYVTVTASKLNVRSGASSSNSKVSDRNPALFGAVLRVYQEKNNWYKISSSSQHWVSAIYTREVKRALVNAQVLNVRSGIGTNFPKLGAVSKGTEVFIYAQKNGWSRISIDEKWVKDEYLDIE